jgi:acyl-CoA reductase-like NAD-dependent aldehyde dehydrogenase
MLPYGFIGPILPIVPVENMEEAIQIINER